MSSWLLIFVISDQPPLTAVLHFDTWTQSHLSLFVFRTNEILNTVCFFKFQKGWDQNWDLNQFVWSEDDREAEVDQSDNVEGGPEWGAEQDVDQDNEGDAMNEDDHQGQDQV